MLPVVEVGNMWGSEDSYLYWMNSNLSAAFIMKINHSFFYNRSYLNNKNRVSM